MKLKINVREYRRENQKWTIQRNWQDRVSVHTTNTSKTSIIWWFVFNFYCDKSKYVLTENCGIKTGEVLSIPKTQHFVVI